jgi:glycosyltransferase involved in cell wall biosynthesis
MKVLLVSTHISQITGYSKVSYNLVLQLSKVCKLFHFGFQRHPKKVDFRSYPPNVAVYDVVGHDTEPTDGFGFDKIKNYISLVEPDVVMIYNDPLIVCNFLKKMEYKKDVSPYKLWIYLDQVYQGIHPELVKTMNDAAHRMLCFTEGWKTAYESYGSMPVEVMGHAVDPREFPEVQPTMRRQLKIPEDAIVFLNMNRNSSRKRLDLTISGFIQFLKTTKTNSCLLLVTGDGYYDISRICKTEMERWGIEENRIRIVNSSTHEINDATINDIYRSCDIGINTSDGEGYGLTVLEHLYCGKPQIITKLDCYSEFVPDSVVEFVEPVDRTYMSMALGLYAPTFTSDSVALAMHRMVDTLDSKRQAVKEMKFKTWDEVCKDLIRI